MKTLITRLLAVMLAAWMMVPAYAADITPNFADLPTDWTVDRYAPASFDNIGTYEGRDNVLGIGISTADGLGSRNPGQNSTFYNTQGKQKLAPGEAEDSLAAGFFVDSAFANEANGSVRTDMWGVMTDGTSVTDYTIIGFSNYGGTGRFRVWDSDIGFVELQTAVVYGAWTSFKTLFTGSSYEYFVNDELVYTDTSIFGSTGFSAVIMQAYNFAGDPALTGAVASDYTAYWSNEVAEVAEPAVVGLMGLGFAAIVFGRRRRRQPA